MRSFIAILFYFHFIKLAKELSAKIYIGIISKWGENLNVCPVWRNGWKYFWDKYCFYQISWQISTYCRVCFQWSLSSNYANAYLRLLRCQLFFVVVAYTFNPSTEGLGQAGLVQGQPGLQSSKLAKATPLRPCHKSEVKIPKKIEALFWLSGPG